MTTEIELQLKRIITETIDTLENINLENLEISFSEIGVDSLSFIKLATRIEVEFDFEFDDDYLDVKKFENLMALIHYIEQKCNQ